MNRAVTVVTSILLFEGSCLLASAQGPLAPTGPPGPMMRTLKQVEPRTPISSLPYDITQRGSYYLQANVAGQAGTNGITITTDDVTLDLNGFTMGGVAGSLTGILVSGTRANISIRNGVVRGWGEHGVDAWLAKNSSIENVKAYTNGWDGASNDGLRLGTGGLITRCQAWGNQRDGIFGLWCNVYHCVADGNGQNGIEAGSGTRVVGNITTLNKRDGIHASGDCLITGNNAYGNGHQGDGAGIHVSGRGSRIDSNNVTQNDRGIEVNLGDNIIIRNTADDNGTNYVISAGNAHAQVLSPGIGFVNTDPTANFAF